MIGKKVRVFWPVDNSWYKGIVQEYDETSGEHLLKYTDGDTEWVKIGENNTTGGDIGEPEGGDAAGKGDDRNKWATDPAAAAAAAGAYPGYFGYGSGAGGMYGAPPGSMPNMMPPQYPGGAAPGMMYAAGANPYGMFYGSAPPKMDPHDHSTSSYGRRKNGPKAWSKHEDELLLSIVQSMQWPMKWTVVAQSLPDRTGKQCRERYVNHLNPRLKVSDWTIVEDATIFHLYNLIGSHWAKMSKVIPGRTDNGIKNRFHNIRRQYEREDEHRMRLSNNSDFVEDIRLHAIRENLPEHLRGNSAKLWDMHSAMGILAAQSAMDNSATGGRGSNRFGPFRDPKTTDQDGNDTNGEQCVRCGLFVPSVQTGFEICTKTGWCKSCTRLPPHASSNFLRECLNLRRCPEKELRPIIEAWTELFGIVDETPQGKDESQAKDEGGVELPEEGVSEEKTEDV